MKRILVRTSIVAPTRLWLDVNWYDTDTLEQDGAQFTFEDTGSYTGDELYAAINDYIVSQVGGESVNILWI
jgi:hypothetical protein